MQFARFIKTNNYHNFTRRLKETDPKCNRYMVDLKVNSVDPEQIQRYCKGEKIDSNIRWIRFTLLGQSFIYHQIRKMIGLLVQLRVRNLPVDETFDKALSTNDKFSVFLSPGYGLYLDSVTFDSYNMKSDAPERLQLNDKELKRVEEFREEIEQVILSHEYKEHLFTKWVIDFYDNPLGIWSLNQSDNEEEAEEEEEEVDAGNDKE